MTLTTQTTDFTPTGEGISLQVREPTPAEEDEDDILGNNDNIDDEDDEEDDDEEEETPVVRRRRRVIEEDDDDEDDVSKPSSSSLGLRFSQHVPRWERRHSNITNPYLTSSHLDITSTVSGSPPTGLTFGSPGRNSSPETTKIKRRSISTCGPLSVSPPTKSLKAETIDPSLLLMPPEETTGAISISKEINTKPPKASGSGVRRHGIHHHVHGHHHHSHHHHHHRPASVRFPASYLEDRLAGVVSRYPYVEMPTGSELFRRDSSGTRCHHMDKKDNNSGATSTTDSPHMVQRTQSNPEMEYCPVCLARKECEILLKRTYSKVNKTIRSFLL